jgi:hypothetical protein
VRPIPRRDTIGRVVRNVRTTPQTALALGATGIALLVLAAILVRSTALSIVTTLVVMGALMAFLEDAGKRMGRSTRGAQSGVTMLAFFVLAMIVAGAADTWWEWVVAAFLALAGVGVAKEGSRIR